ncbi:MAG: sigma factor-like helix-turn-helix DNA-binding protein [Candidatus Poribacteria bacterium]
MSKFDPHFWEIAVEPDLLEKFSEENAIWYETEEEREQRYKKEDIKKQILPVIIEIIENELTDMQKNCIKMHFLHEKSKDEVANILGISRRVVTQHIYGICRHGKRIGGGIEKIKKICQKRCITI